LEKKGYFDDSLEGYDVEIEVEVTADEDESSTYVPVDFLSQLEDIYDNPERDTDASENDNTKDPPSDEIRNVGFHSSGVVKSLESNGVTGKIDGGFLYGWAGGVVQSITMYYTKTPSDDGSTSIFEIKSVEATVSVDTSSTSLNVDRLNINAITVANKSFDFNDFSRPDKEYLFSPTTNFTVVAINTKGMIFTSEDKLTISTEYGSQVSSKDLNVVYTGGKGGLTAEIDFSKLD